MEAPISVALRCPDLGLCSPELGQQHQTAPEGQGLALATRGTAEWPLVAQEVPATAVSWGHSAAAGKVHFRRAPSWFSPN